MGLGAGLSKAGLGNAITEYEARLEIERAKEEKRILEGSGQQNPYTDSMVGKRKGTKDYEGFRNKVYTDTTGNTTIGYGHKLTQDEIDSGIYDMGISKEMGEQIFGEDRDRELGIFYKENPWATELPDDVRYALEDMSFNMGGSWMDKWQDTKGYLQRGEFGKAATNIKGSKYASQVGQRAIDNASLIGGM